MRSRKKRLSKQDLRDLGATPGRLTTRYGPNGRATIRQVVGEAKTGSLFLRNTPTQEGWERGGESSN